MTQLVALDDAEICQVRDQVAKIPLDLRQRFQATYAVWQQTWTSVALSSAPAARANSTEFAKLIALGPPILPLLMEKLTDPDEFFALVAVDRFLAPELRARPSFGDESVLLGEQGRAIETVRRWLRIVS